MEIIDSIEREERVDNPRHEQRLKNIGDGHVLGHGVNEVGAGVVAVDEEGGGAVGVVEEAEAAGEGREEIEGARERELEMLNNRKVLVLWLWRWSGFEKEKALLDGADQKKLEIPWS